MSERDPYGKSPNESGAKLDFGKAPIYRGVLDYFPRAIRAVAEVSGKGAAKYTWKGWENVPDGVSRYTDALGRHLVSEPIEGPYDQETGLLHKAQVAWNALAALELYIREQDGAKRVSNTSAKDAATASGRDLLPTESVLRGGGSIGGYSQGPATWSEAGYGSTQKGTR